MENTQVGKLKMNSDVIVNTSDHVERSVSIFRIPWIF